MLARLQSEYRDRGFRVLAVNIDSGNFRLEEWAEFINRYVPEELPGFAESSAVQDINNQAVRQYQLRALGTEVLVDRQGQVALRSEGPMSYGKLSSEVERLLLAN